MPLLRFNPFRGRDEHPDLESRLRVIEDALRQLAVNRNVVRPGNTGVVVAGAQGQGSSSTSGGTGGTSSSIDVLDGTGTAIVSGADALQFGTGLTTAADSGDSQQADVSVTPHALLDGVINSDTTAGTVHRGDVITGQGASPTWERLALGANGTYLGSNGTDASWSTPTGSPHPLLDGNINSDTTNSTPVAGDLIVANSTPKWTRLALGTANYVLKVVAGAVTWGQVAISELTGHLSDIATGDVTYSNNAGTVTALRGHNLPAPGSSDDGHALFWDSGGSAYTWLGAVTAGANGTYYQRRRVNFVDNSVATWTAADSPFSDYVQVQLASVNATPVTTARCISVGDTTSNAWAVPAALTEWQSPKYRTKYDLSSATQVRLVASVSVVAGSTAEYRIQYSTDGGTNWAYLDGSTGPAISLTSTGVQASSWVNLANAAKADVLLRPVGINGDGSTSGTFHLPLLQVK